MIGEVTDDAKFSYSDTEITLKEALSTWEGTLEGVFKTAAGTEEVKADDGSLYKADSIYVCKHKVAKPRVFIPVFPGTNCEYDSTVHLKEQELRLMSRYSRILLQKISMILWKSLRKPSARHR